MNRQIHDRLGAGRGGGWCFNLGGELAVHKNGFVNSPKWGEAKTSPKWGECKDAKKG